MEKENVRNVSLNNQNNQKKNFDVTYQDSKANIGVEVPTKRERAEFRSNLQKKIIK